jgi:hypothetical protein
MGADWGREANRSSPLVLLLLVSVMLRMDNPAECDPFFASTQHRTLPAPQMQHFLSVELLTWRKFLRHR